jgi:uncharacterized integral membrane protein (TIGR00698 family)
VVDVAPGLAAAAVVAAAAFGAAQVIPLAGAPVLALALGIAVAALRRPAERLGPGLRLAMRHGLQLGIVVLGATMSLGHVVSVGGRTLPVMLGSLAAALAVAVVAGRLLGVGPRLQALIGIGTGICGASAIAAVATVVEVTEAELAYAVTTIFAFNLVAVVLFPAIGHALGLGQTAFGVWSGTAVNDTSSVVAVAYSYGHAAGAEAVIVKLTRTTMIVPVVAALAARHRDARVGWTGVIPWFLVWFALAAALRTAGAIPQQASGGLKDAAVVLLTVALAAVGLMTRLDHLRRAGSRPLLLGTVVWVAVAVSSLALQRATGIW